MKVHSSPSLPQTSRKSCDSVFVRPQYPLTDRLLTTLSTDDEFTKYIQTWFPEASPADLQPILEAYSPDPASGSPFDTGDANAFASQYKRISALQGDWFFNAPRRVLLDKYSSTQPTYNFCKCQLLIGS